MHFARRPISRSIGAIDFAASGLNSKGSRDRTYRLSSVAPGGPSRRVMPIDASQERKEKKGDGKKGEDDLRDNT